MRGLRERLTAACTVLILLSGSWACRGSSQEIALLHFNDYHGQIRPVRATKAEPCGGLARLAALAGILAGRERADGRFPFLLFAGDAFTGTTTSEMFQGEPDFQAFRKMGLAAIVPGNHDWDFGSEVLKARARSLPAPVLLANARPLPGVMAFFRPAVTLQAGRFRIGVIGVSRPDTALITKPGATEGYAFEDPAPAVARVLRSRGPAAWDFVVVLSHCGLEEDLRIARANPGVGLIIGGHDHIALFAPAAEAGVPIVQAGDRGRYMGLVRVALTKGKPAQVTASLVPVTAELPQDAGIQALLAPCLNQEERMAGTVVANLPAPLEGRGSRNRPTPLGSFAADALREASGADVAFVNGGAIRGDLPGGDVAGRDLVEAMPFDDTLWTVRLKGKAIRALLDRCASHASAGPWGGYLQASGLTVVYRKGRAQDILVGGNPIEDDADYLVACNSFLAGGGDGHAEFASGGEPRDWGLGVRDLLARKLLPPAVGAKEGSSPCGNAPGSGPIRKAA